MKANILEKLEANELIAAKDKDAVKSFLEISNKIEFGKIAPRVEGYILGDYKQPRCTSVLQMDGTKAGALMEWAKKQVAGHIESILLESIKVPGSLSSARIIEICQEGLEDPDKQRDDAADIGSEVHDEAEDILTGYKTLEDCVHKESIMRFEEAWKKSGLTVVGTEIPVIWHDENGNGFGGRLDILAYKDGKFYIGDNKTSRSVHGSYGIQVGAYKAAVEQMSNGSIKIEGGYIFHIPQLDNLNDRQLKEYNKRGSLIELKDLDNAFEHFRLLLGLYARRNTKYF